jgi:hypothetical protein
MNEDYNPNYDKYPQPKKTRRQVPVIVQAIAINVAINAVSALILVLFLK